MEANRTGTRLMMIELIFDTISWLQREESTEKESLALSEAERGESRSQVRETTATRRSRLNPLDKAIVLHTFPQVDQRKTYFETKSRLALPLTWSDSFDYRTIRRCAAALPRRRSWLPDTAERRNSVCRSENRFR